MCIVSQYYCLHLSVFKCHLKESHCLKQTKFLSKAGANCDLCAKYKLDNHSGWRSFLLLETRPITVFFDGYEKEDIYV